MMQFVFRYVECLTMCCEMGSQCH